MPLKAAAIVIPGGTPPGCEPLSWSRSTRRREPADLSPGDPAVRRGLAVPPVATSGASPEKTTLHKIVSELFESWLEWRDQAEWPVPGYVEEELRGYLD